MDQQQIERGVESIIRQFGDDWGIGLEMIYDRRELATPSLKDVPYEQIGQAVDALALQGRIKDLEPPYGRWICS